MLALETGVHHFWFYIMESGVTPVFCLYFRSSQGKINCMSYTVAQNTYFLTTASIIQKVVSFVYFTILARIIGVGNTGSYFFAITFTTIFTVVADFGMGPVLTREVAKFPERAATYMNTVLASKIMFGFLTYFLVAGLTILLDYPISLRNLILLSGVTMFFDNLQSSFFGIFRAQKNLVYESVALIISQILTLIIGTIALLMQAPLIWLIMAYTIPSVVIVCYGAFFVHRVYGLVIWPRIDRQVFRNFLLLAIPFAIAGLLGRLYSYSDSLIMSKLLTPQDLGWWSVPYKITFAFQFIPMALSASVYPVISSLTVSDPGKISELFVRAWRYLFIIIFPLSLGLIAVSRPVIIRLYGLEYSPSVPVLRILLVSLFFSYLSIISGALLNATNHQKNQTTLIATALIINVLLNLFLIPRLGILGAAYAALISNVLLWFFGLIFIRRIVILPGASLARGAAHIFSLASLMAVLVYFLTLRMSFIFTIPIGMLVYGGLLFLTGAIDLRIVRVYLQKIRF